MKKIMAMVVFLAMVSAIFVGALGQTSQCFSCKCQEDSGWLGAITDIKVSRTDSGGKALAADLVLELRPGWDGMDTKHCCTVWTRVVQSCIQFTIRGFYFGSSITGWGWDANDDRITSESERMSYNASYRTNYDPEHPDQSFDKNGVFHITIFGIPLLNGVLNGNVYLITTHGEINYFIPAALKWCNKYATGDGYGASIIYVKFW